MIHPITSGRLCEDALRAFDRLCDLERASRAGDDLTPRQRSRRLLLETRSRATEWLVPPVLARTAQGLIEEADRIDDAGLAAAWTDHLPIAVLALLERRSLGRRSSDGDPLLGSG
jgi:hypothetical protein